MWAIDDPTARNVAQGIDPLMPSVNFDLAPAKAHHAIETANGETPEQYERPSKSGQATMARGEAFSAQEFGHAQPGTAQSKAEGFSVVASLHEVRPGRVDAAVVEWRCRPSRRNQGAHFIARGSAKLIGKCTQQTLGT